MIKKIAALFMLFGLILPALASADELWLDLSLTSIHSKPEQHLNQRNYGAGIEYHQGNDVLYMAGAFRNSYDRTSVYALAGWTPVELGLVKAGLLAGAITGYPGLNNGRITPAVAGIVRIEGEYIGANLIIIPPAIKDSPVTVGIQIKFKYR